MKDFFYYFSLLILSNSLIASCSFKDKGLIILNPISDIIIDTTGIPFEQYVISDEKLKISPIVKREGVSEDNFTYEWRITRMPGSNFLDYEIISTEKHLNEFINLIPTTDYYSLWYRVTDITTGLMSGIIFRLYLDAAITQGLVITDSKDGVKSDFSLIQDTLFTDNWIDENGKLKNTIFKRNLYSAANGVEFDGIVHSLYANRLFKDGIYNKYLHGASKHNIFRLNSFDYTLTASGSELFYDPFITLNIERYFMNGNTRNWIINNQKISQRFAESRTSVEMRKFGISVPGDYTANKHIAVHPITNQEAIFYDESLGKFLKMGKSLNTKAPPLEVDASTTVFNGRNLPGYTVLGGGLGNLTETRFVMKKDNYYGVFCFTNAGVPRRLIDISDAPDIENAISFVFPIDQAVIYYATSSKVYSIRIPQGGAPTYTDLYTSPDPITLFIMMRRALNQTLLNTERVLLLATYNGSEGKVTALPIPEAGLDLGIIDVDRKATFGGFNKISAMAIQL